MSRPARHLLLACLTGGLFLSACDGKKEKKISPLGITPEEETEPAAYDLDQIRQAGELIAATLSGPDTYYEYKGRGFGLQFEMAESFASTIGARLRMETARDTVELFRRLKSGEIDLIARENAAGAGWCGTTPPSWPRRWTDGTSRKQGLSCKTANGKGSPPGEG